jgi:hypothetical protein
MKHIILKSWLFFLVAAVAMGCYPGGAEYVSDTDIVVTDYNESFNFANKRTYFLPDTVQFTTNDDDLDLRPADEEALLEEIHNQMESRGYVYTAGDATSAPDFFMAVEVSAISRSGGAWVPGPWYPWYPPGWGWGSGWGWYYPPGYYVPYEYATGTVIVFLSDPNNPVTEAGETNIPLVWTAVLNGLLGTSAGTTQSRIVNGVQQAFDQSPYLESDL